MKISREQAEEHLNAGRPVAFQPQGEQPPRTLQVPEGGKRAVKARLPGQDEPGEYVLLRDEKGNLTRAGMEQVMRDGGTVMIDGKLIEHRDDLPSEADLAKGDERRAAQVRDAYDARIAELMAERSKLDQPAEQSREGAIMAGQQLPPRGEERPQIQPQPPASRPRPQPPTGREKKE